MSENREVGRPHKLTPERQAAIFQDIADGIPYQLAAESNGIAEDTLYEWINRGMRDSQLDQDTVFSRFSEGLKMIEKKRINAHMQMISQSPERWQAHAWLLERRWWKHFSANSAVVDFNKRLEQLEANPNGELNVQTLKQEAKQVTQK